MVIYKISCISIYFLSYSRRCYKLNSFSSKSKMKKCRHYIKNIFFFASQTETYIFYNIFLQIEKLSLSQIRSKTHWHIL